LELVQLARVLKETKSFGFDVLSQVPLTWGIFRVWTWDFLICFLILQLLAFVNSGQFDIFWLEFLPFWQIELEFSWGDSS
jgi:hypothetical protein